MLWQTVKDVLFKERKLIVIEAVGKQREMNIRDSLSSQHSASPNPKPERPGRQQSLFKKSNINQL